MRTISKKWQYIFMALCGLFLAATPAFAQDAAAGGSAAGLGTGFSALAACLGIGIAAGLAGLGQGRATASATEAMARNPGARAGILLLLTLGLAFMESLVLFTFVIVLLRTK
jgi:F-type H+-transporting ATPase subunit c